MPAVAVDGLSVGRAPYRFKQSSSLRVVVCQQRGQCCHVLVRVLLLHDEDMPNWWRRCWSRMRSFWAIKGYNFRFWNLLQRVASFRTGTLLCDSQLRQEKKNVAADGGSSQRDPFFFRTHKRRGHCRRFWPTRAGSAHHFQQKSAVKFVPNKVLYSLFSRNVSLLFSLLSLCACEQEPFSSSFSSLFQLKVFSLLLPRFTPRFSVLLWCKNGLTPRPSENNL